MTCATDSVNCGAMVVAFRLHATAANCAFTLQIPLACFVFLRVSDYDISTHANPHSHGVCSFVLLPKRCKCFFFFFFCMTRGALVTSLLRAVVAAVASHGTNEHTKPNGRCVLAAQSVPLRTMFEGAFKERRESVIALRDVEPSSFSLLLDFFYDRDVSITADNVEALLDLSARYAVSMLRRHCCAFLARSASPGNACSLLAVADRYDCHRLRRGLLAYILEVCT